MYDIFHIEDDSEGQMSDGLSTKGALKSIQRFKAAKNIQQFIQQLKQLKIKRKGKQSNQTNNQSKPGDDSNEDTANGDTVPPNTKIVDDKASNVPALPSTGKGKGSHEGEDDDLSQPNQNRSGAQSLEIQPSSTKEISTGRQRRKSPPTVGQKQEENDNQQNSIEQKDNKLAMAKTKQQWKDGKELLELYHPPKPGDEMLLPTSSNLKQQFNQRTTFPIEADTSDDECKRLADFLWNHTDVKACRKNNDKYSLRHVLCHVSNHFLHWFKTEFNQLFRCFLFVIGKKQQKFLNQYNNDPSRRILAFFHLCERHGKQFNIYPVQEIKAKSLHNLNKNYLWYAFILCQENSQASKYDTFCSRSNIATSLTSDECMEGLNLSKTTQSPFKKMIYGTHFGRAGNKRFTDYFGGGETGKKARNKSLQQKVKKTNIVPGQDLLRGYAYTCRTTNDCSIPFEQDPPFHRLIEYTLKDIIEALWMIVAVPSMSYLGGCDMYGSLRNRVKDFEAVVELFQSKELLFRGMTSEICQYHILTTRRYLDCVRQHHSKQDGKTWGVNQGQLESRMYHLIF